MVYQEQIMRIVRDMAGIPWRAATSVRRAMSKKQQAVLEKRAARVYIRR
jgi:DNA polymerase-3 subunit alpha